MRTKKLISFDFDDTLVKTPLPEEGKIVWKEKTGTDWPHRGWWSKPESLDMEIFDIPLNKHIYEDYERLLSDPENYIVLATGRITALRDEVDIILDHYGLDFDEIHLNPGEDTYEFKKQLFGDLIDKLQPEEYIMYDDRDIHLEKFVEWAKTLPCKTTIIDAKTGQVFQEKKPLEENISRIKQMMGLITEEKEKKVLYSAVVLDKDSRDELLDKLDEYIPSDWKKIAHHMTIKFGEGVDDVGEEVELTVTDIGISNMAIAAKVKGYTSSNKIPHVTLAVNPDGGKPVMSNKIEDWKKVKPFKIKGEVKNVTN